MTGLARSSLRIATLPGNEEVIATTCLI